MSTLGWLLVPESAVPFEHDWLSPGEQMKLGGMRLPKRRADFRLGRWAAKLAVRAWSRRVEDRGGPAHGALAAALADAREPSFAEIDVRAAPDGAPEVRLPGGVIGPALSIAHSGGRAIAVVGPHGSVFGADLETIEPRSAAFLEDYLTEPERHFVYSSPEERRAWAATLVWSAKESVLKALRQGLREDTRDVEIRAGDGSDRGAFRSLSATAHGRTFEGLAAEIDGQVMTVVAEAARPRLTPLLGA